ncbi:MAG: diguanylate cyclase, partial [Clostridium sp.]|nr:diguanylate cyclase [Clostridium sp.]
MQKRIVTMLLAAALLVSGVLSILSIHGLQGNARIINYTGVVMGATQRLIKQEMNGQHNDALIARLDGILNELATGQGDNGILRLENDAFQELIAQMQDQWEEIKD